MDLNATYSSFPSHARSSETSRSSPSGVQLTSTRSCRITSPCMALEPLLPYHSIRPDDAPHAGLGERVTYTPPRTDIYHGVPVVQAQVHGAIRPKANVPKGKQAEPEEKQAELTAKEVEVTLTESESKEAEVALCATGMEELESVQKATDAQMASVLGIVDKAVVARVRDSSTPLKSLHACVCGLHDRSCIALGSLLTAAHLSTVQSIDLSHNRIGDDGCAAMARALYAGAPALRRLALHENNIGERGMCELVEDGQMQIRQRMHFRPSE